MDDRYKKRGLKFNNTVDSRVLRAVHNQQRQRDQRDNVVNLRRRMENLESSPHVVKPKEVKSGVDKEAERYQKGLERYQKLMKWKEMKKKRMEREKKKRMPAFKTGVYHPSPPKYLVSSDQQDTEAKTPLASLKKKAFTPGQSLRKIPVFHLGGTPATSLLRVPQFHTGVTPAVSSKHQAPVVKQQQEQENLRVSHRTRGALKNGKRGGKSLAVRGRATRSRKLDDHDDLGIKPLPPTPPVTAAQRKIEMPVLPSRTLPSFAPADFAFNFEVTDKKNSSEENVGGILKAECEKPPQKEAFGSDISETCTDEMQTVSEGLPAELHGDLMHDKSSGPEDNVEQGTDENPDEDLSEKIDKDLNEKIDEDLSEKIDEDLSEKIDEDLNEKIDEDLNEKIDKDLKEKINEDVSEKIDEDLKEKIDGDLNENPDEDLSEKIDEDLNEKIDEDLNKKRDGDLNENIDADLSEKIDGDFSEKQDGDLDENIDADLSKTQDGDLNEETDEDLNEKQDGDNENIDADVNETQDGDLSEKLSGGQVTNEQNSRCDQLQSEDETLNPNDVTSVTLEVQHENSSRPRRSRTATPGKPLTRRSIACCFDGTVTPVLSRLRPRTPCSRSTRRSLSAHCDMPHEIITPRRRSTRKTPRRSSSKKTRGQDCLEAQSVIPVPLSLDEENLTRDAEDRMVDAVNESVSQSHLQGTTDVNLIFPAEKGSNSPLLTPENSVRRKQGMWTVETSPWINSQRSKKKKSKVSDLQGLFDDIPTDGSPLPPPVIPSASVSHGPGSNLSEDPISTNLLSLLQPSGSDNIDSPDVNVWDEESPATSTLGDQKTSRRRQSRKLPQEKMDESSAEMETDNAMESVPSSENDALPSEHPLFPVDILSPCRNGKNAEKKKSRKSVMFAITEEDTLKTATYKLPGTPVRRSSRVSMGLFAKVDPSIDGPVVPDQDLIAFDSPMSEKKTSCTSRRKSSRVSLLPGMTLTPAQEETASIPTDLMTWDSPASGHGASSLATPKRRSRRLSKSM